MCCRRRGVDSWKSSRRVFTGQVLGGGRNRPWSSPPAPQHRRPPTLYGFENPLATNAQWRMTAHTRQPCRSPQRRRHPLVAGTLEVADTLEDPRPPPSSPGPSPSAGHRHPVPQPGTNTGITGLGALGRQIIDAGTSPPRCARACWATSLARAPSHRQHAIMAIYGRRRNRRIAFLPQHETLLLGARPAPRRNRGFARYRTMTQGHRLATSLDYVGTTRRPRGGGSALSGLTDPPGRISLRVRLPRWHRPDLI